MDVLTKRKESIGCIAASIIAIMLLVLAALGEYAKAWIWAKAFGR